MYACNPTSAPIVKGDKYESFQNNRNQYEIVLRVPDRDKPCSDNCRECVSVEGACEACADWYRGQPPPKCDTDRENHVIAYGGIATP
jgi:hypothetical protein